MDFNTELNEAIKAANDGRLGEYGEDKLRFMLTICSQYRASNPREAFAETPINLIRDEIRSRQEAKQHQEALSEQKRLHELQLKDSERMSREASEEEQKRYKQTHGLAKMGVWIAVVALIVAAIALIRDLRPEYFESASSKKATFGASQNVANPAQLGLTPTNSTVATNSPSIAPVAKP